MKQIDFYFDVISPYAYLAFEKLPQTLMGLSYSVVYRPVLLAGLLRHHGQLGPAEITGKRDWMYREVLWKAHASGLPLQVPAVHPFNPLALLRLALACGRGGACNRYVTERILHHVWHGGLDANDPERLQALAQQLAPARDPLGEEVKQELRSSTEGALAAGCFGVPTLVADGRLFWGFDALPMLGDFLRGDAWFVSGAWEAAARIPMGASRRRSA